MKKKSLWLSTALIFIYAFSRLHNILALPLFIDEGTRIVWAQDVWDLRPIHFAHSGQVLGVWWMSLFWPFANAAWIGRVTTILLSLPGLAAAIAAARLLGNRRSAWAVGALYILCPFLFFFDRLALADSTAASIGMVMIWLAVRTAKHARTRDALLCGLTLTLMTLSKALAVTLLPVPFLAMFILPAKHSWRSRLRPLATIYGAFALTFLPWFILFTLRKHPFFMNFSHYGVGQSKGLLSTFGDNLDLLLSKLSTYMTPWLVILIGVAAVILILYRPRTGLYLTLVGVLHPLGLLMPSSQFASRHVVMALPPLLLILGVGLTQLPAKKKWGTAGIAAGVVGLWALTFALPFQLAAVKQPEQLDIPHQDQLQYITGDASGYGIREAAEHLSGIPGESTHTHTHIHVIGLVSNCHILGFYIPRGPDIIVECPTIAWDGSRQLEIEALVGQRAAEGKPLYIVEEGLPFVEIGSLPVRLELVKTFPRPGRETTVTLYRVHL